MILRRVEQIGSREQSREIFCDLDAVQQHGSSDFVHDKAARQQGWVTLSARALGSVGSLAGLNFSVSGFATGGRLLFAKDERSFENYPRELLGRAKVTSYPASGARSFKLQREFVVATENGVPIGMPCFQVLPSF